MIILSQKRKISHPILLWSMALVLVLTACSQDKLPLPVPKVKPTSFAANDTNYVELSPIWDASNLGYAFAEPQDITVGPDGIIFVADKGNDRVVALSKAGEILTSHGLGAIEGIPGPMGVTIDSKLNLLVTNGTDTLYGWNQYFNYVGIDSVAERAVFTIQGEDTVLSFRQVVEMAAAGEPVPDVRSPLFEKDEALIAQATSVYPIYVDKQEDAQLNGVAAGRFGSNVIYVTESNYDRITRIRLVPRLAVKTRQGAVLFQYQGVRERDVATFGSGAGTVDDPWGIATDREENIYFTQLGGNFRVQKLQAQTYAPVYVLYQHDIMDLNRFVAPMDIDLDDQGNIFVVDRDLRKVFKFGNAGRKAGQLLDLGTRGLAVTEFANARGILADEDIIYVVESGRNRIRRFQLSISESDIPDDDKKP